MENRYFKSVVNINYKTRSGKVKQRERVLYINTKNAVDAYAISKKVRPSRIVSVTPIDRNQYIRGVSSQ